MAIYAIGDLQGCYEELCRLLEKIEFDASRDKLWFCGDLVNRGPDSLHTLRLVKSLGKSALTVLGNHDLHLLALYHGINKVSDNTGLRQVLDSPDCGELLSWLQQRPLLHYDKKQKAVLVHAGIYPGWGLSKARRLAAEVETALRDKPQKFLESMYGDKPAVWSDDLNGARRRRFITNAFTRMRFLKAGLKLDFNASGSPRQHLGSGLTPWFQAKSAMRDDLRILFGHWSTLPVGCYGRCFSLDGSCVWGGHMVALRIDNDAEDWFFVDSYTKRPIKAVKSC